MPYCRCHAAARCGACHVAELKTGPDTGALRPGFEAMVRAKDDSCLGAGQLEQTLQHHVVKAVGAFNDTFEKGEVFFLDPLQFGRVIGHEGVAKMVDAIVIDSGEIPRLCLHQRRCDRMNGSVIT